MCKEQSGIILLANDEGTALRTLPLVAQQTEFAAYHRGELFNLSKRAGAGETVRTGLEAELCLMRRLLGLPFRICCCGAHLAAAPLG